MLIELKTSVKGGHAPKMNAGLNDSDRVRKEIIIYYVIGSTHISFIRGLDLLPTALVAKRAEYLRKAQALQDEYNTYFKPYGYVEQDARRLEFTTNSNSLFLPSVTAFNNTVDYVVSLFQ